MENFSWRDWNRNGIKLFYLFTFSLVLFFLTPFLCEKTKQNVQGGKSRIAVKFSNFHEMSNIFWSQNESKKKFLKFARWGKSKEKCPFALHTWLLALKRFSTTDEITQLFIFVTSLTVRDEKIVIQQETILLDAAWFYFCWRQQFFQP